MLASEQLKFVERSGSPAMGLVTLQVFASSFPFSISDAFQRLPVARCRPSMFSYWSIICPDPVVLVSGFHGLYSTPVSHHRHHVANVSALMDDCSSHAEASSLHLRKAYVASIQEHYFKRNPPLIERAWKQFMYDSKCRCVKLHFSSQISKIIVRAYLDTVNNVTVLGHCHPAVRNASSRQLDLLNTNSRFLYPKLGEFAEHIIKTVEKYKQKLNVVFFVNSGSEATDLALRLARSVVTDRRRRLAESGATSHRLLNIDCTRFCRDVICLEGAYHGITTASDEVTTTLNDNPRSRDSRPPWIHLAPMPNLYRGRYTPENTGLNDPEAIGELYAKHVSDLVTDMLRKGIAPAAFIAEPLSGNAGGVEIPPGYLRRVYEEMRSLGALCICDEVQVGYGRLGSNFWGFEEHGVVPDILTMAKAAGNGHPLGFVITSREIADEFGADGSFFSSAGGGPVSCAIGQAVLQTIEQEKLQRNAKEVGGYLRDKLLTLRAKYPHIVGCIHGHGLYMGIEIILPVEGRESERVPGTAAAYAICERMLELGVICHNTGDFSNVLKVKPPLCFTKENADFFTAALERTFACGW